MPVVLDTFTPPPRPPEIVTLALAKDAGAPISVESHGWGFTVSGNTLLSRETVQKVLRTAQTPQEALNALNAAYRNRGYLLVAMRAQVKDKKVAIAVIEGQISSLKAQPGVRSFYSGVEFDPALNENSLIRRNILAEMYASRSGLGFRPSVAPAPQPGGSQLTVDTPEQDHFKRYGGSLVFGNYGSRYVGGDVASKPV